MSESPLGQRVPGFDFLQGLMRRGAGAASVPGFGHWVAPTLDPDEIARRIDELKAVQFWLEQNARLLGTTIQALEVQRMTLSTLKTMNVSMGELAESMRVKPPAPADPPAPEAAPPAAWPVWTNPFATLLQATTGDDAAAADGPTGEEPADPAPAPARAAPTADDRPAPEPAHEDPPPMLPPRAARTPRTPRRRVAAEAEQATQSAADTAAARPTLDPLQWWNALTQQFAGLAQRTLATEPSVAPADPAPPQPAATTGTPAPAPKRRRVAASTGEGARAPVRRRKA